MSNNVKQFALSIVRDSRATMANPWMVRTSLITPFLSCVYVTANAPNEFLHGAAHGTAVGVGAWAAGQLCGSAIAAIMHFQCTPFKPYLKSLELGFKRIRHPNVEAFLKEYTSHSKSLVYPNKKILPIVVALNTIFCGAPGAYCADIGFSKLFGVSHVFLEKQSKESGSTRSGVTREGRAYTFKIG